MNDSTYSPPSPSKLKSKNINEWRCECGKLLFKGAFLAGLLEVKCSRCKRMVYLQQFNSYTAQRQSFMATLSSEGTILTVSRGIEDILGYQQEALIGKNFIEYINPNLHTIIGFWLEGIELKKNDKNPYASLVLPLIAKDSKETIFSLLIRSTHLGGQDIYIVIAEAGLSSADAHDKKVLSKLAQKSRKQRESWDFIINSKGQVIDSSGKSSLGFEKDELLGKSFSGLLQSPSKSLASSLKEQKGFILPLNLKTRSADYKEYKVCFTPDFIAEPDKPAFIVALRPQISSQAAQQSASTSQTSGA